MTTAAWIETALSQPVYNIGQIDKATAKELDKLVRAGKLTKERWLWAGMCMKTVWAPAAYAATARQRLTP
jgi:hypothetical protein